MSRRKDHHSDPEGWPVEWTFAGMVVFSLLLLSQISKIWSMFFIGQCTTLGGMCTPADCSCPEPLRKRELVTQDAQACFQCVADFCPVVADGDQDCSTSDCECEDPTWPRVDLQLDGQPCWQCIRPYLDFTVSIGSGDNTSCLALTSREGARRLAPSSSASECLAFRYNGASIAEKRRNESCLAWQPFGAFWDLAACDLQNPRMHFRKLVDDEALAVIGASGSEVYCSGENASEFCIEVAESLCTEEEGRCSTEQCRCEDPTWIKQELQTLNGSQCYTCIPPPVLCTTEEDKCTAGPCECASSSHVKVLDDTSSSEVPCFRCQLGLRHASGGSEAYSLGMLVIFVLTGLAVGGCIRRFRDPTSGGATSTGRGKRGKQVATEGHGTWSERLAVELEDILEALFEFFVENPMLLMRWARPQLRQIGRWLSWALDEFDMALEPCYCVVDNVQEAVWDWVVVQHERLVAASVWAYNRYSDLAEWFRAVKPCWNDPGDFDDEVAPSATASKGRSKRSTGPRTREAQKQSQHQHQQQGAATTAQATAKVSPTGKTAGDQQPHLSATLSPKVCPDVAAPALDSFNASVEAESFNWDPLGLSAGADAQAETEPDCATTEVPEEIVRRLMGTSGFQQQVAKHAQPPAQSRVQRKLQQRREALAQRLAEPSAEPVDVPPIDDSWIDELEDKSKSKKNTKSSKPSKKKGAKQAGDLVADEPVLASSPLPSQSEPMVQEERGEQQVARDVADLDAFDPERLLSEAMHGLFLVLEEQGASPLVTTKGKKAAKKEVAIEKKEAVKDPEKTSQKMEEKQAGKQRQQAQAQKKELTAAPVQRQQSPCVDEAVDPNKKEDGFEEGRRHRKGANKRAQQQMHQQELAAIVPPREPSAPQQAEQKAEQHAQKPEQQPQSRTRQSEAHKANAQLPRVAQASPAQTAVQESPQQTQQSEAQKANAHPPRAQQATPAPTAVQEQPPQQPKSRPTSFAAAVSGGSKPTPAAKPPATLGSQSPQKAQPKSQAAVGSSAGAEKPAQNPAEGPAEKRVWAQVVAPWAKGGPPEDTDADKVKSTMEAEAPEFIPSFGQSFGKSGVWGTGISTDPAAMAVNMLTTVMVSGVPPDSTAETFMNQLELWGLGGSYDFFHMPVNGKTGESTGFAFINFIDPVFVMLFCWIYQECQFQGSVTMADVQGCEANRLHWANSSSPADEFTVEPVIMNNAMPSQWAVNSANTMLSPQLKDQFRKTKMCVFNKKNRCHIGPNCPFAHSKEELQPIPDLAKTKLCYNFFRRRCNDPQCKFAHGSAELRSVWVPYSPGIWFPAADDATEWNPIGEELHTFGNHDVNAEDLQAYEILSMFPEVPFTTQVSNSSSAASLGYGSVLPAVPEVAGTTKEHLGTQRDLFEPLPLTAGGVRSRAESQPEASSVALRVRGTFMEAMQVAQDDDDDNVFGGQHSMQRSFSDSQLAQLREAMEEAYDL
eukprot:TRINITY_DN92027_c0_g1_i1.p1 TRINITY_DN92027_c0_g1~~TRINITY_DN92027_c0_g1_i1.p1  ORF type:complete len:1460 (-),score=324.55 TRINITY_DN92027_c0_g1_i1:101-4480(-)